MSAEVETVWQWIGFPEPGRFMTYDTFPYKEHPVDVQYAHVKTVADLQGIKITESPTSCYFEIREAPTEDDIVFYMDQQGCAVWALEKATGAVIVIDRYPRTYVAKSLAEFLSHINDDNREWYQKYGRAPGRVYTVNTVNTEDTGEEGTSSSSGASTDDEMEDMLERGPPSCVVA